VPGSTPATLGKLVRTTNDSFHGQCRLPMANKPTMPSARPAKTAQPSTIACTAERERDKAALLKRPQISRLNYTAKLPLGPYPRTGLLYVRTDDDGSCSFFIVDSGGCRVRRVWSQAWDSRTTTMRHS